MHQGREGKTPQQEQELGARTDDRWRKYCANWEWQRLYIGHQELDTWEG